MLILKSQHPYTDLFFKIQLKERSLQKEFILLHNKKSYLPTSARSCSRRAYYRKQFQNRFLEWGTVLYTQLFVLWSISLHIWSQRTSWDFLKNKSRYMISIHKFLMRCEKNRFSLVKPKVSIAVEYQENLRFYKQKLVFLT